MERFNNMVLENPKVSSHESNLDFMKSYERVFLDLYKEMTYLET